MDASKRRAIEAAGWKVGDAADFLEMSAEERQLLDARVELARAIRLQREALHLSQKQLGERLKTTQQRVAKIVDVSGVDNTEVIECARNDSRGRQQQNSRQQPVESYGRHGVKLRER